MIALGALATGLLTVSSNAGSQTFTTSQYNPAFTQVNQSWTYSTPATTSINTSITLTYGYNGSAGGSTSISNSGGYITGAGAGIYTPGTVSNSASAYSQAADTYTVNHQFGSAYTVYGNLSTTLSW